MGRTHSCQNWDIWFVRWWHENSKNPDNDRKERRVVFMFEQGEKLFFLYVSTVLKDEERVVVDPKDPEFHDTGLSELSYIYPGTVKEVDPDDLLGERRVGFLGPGYRQKVMDVLTVLNARRRRKPDQP